MLSGDTDNTVLDIVDHEEIVDNNSQQTEVEDNTKDNEENESSEDSSEEELEEEFLAMLSETSRFAKPKNNEVHSTIAGVWFSVMTKGLEPSTKERLMKQYVREGKISFEAPAMTPKFSQWSTVP